MFNKQKIFQKNVAIHCKTEKEIILLLQFVNNNFNLSPLINVTKYGCKLIKLHNELCIKFYNYGNYTTFSYEEKNYSTKYNKIIEYKDILLEEIMFNKQKIIQPETVVHCDTEEKANNLLAWAHGEGLKWRTDSSYEDENYYEHFLDQTCYNLYVGKYAEYDYYKYEGFIILKYEAVLLNSVSTSLSEDYLVIDSTGEHILTSDTLGKIKFGETELSSFTVNFTWHYDNSADIKTGKIDIDAESFNQACEKAKLHYPNMEIIR
jgi:hypothetical protein